MKFTSVLLAVIVSVILQVTLARYTVGGGVAFDFVLVGVMYSALQWGPVAGMLAGTMGGLLQDMLAGEIVGVGGLAKTLVGCAAGVVGAQFVLARPHGRAVMVMVATVVHRLIILALTALIDQHWPGVSWGAMLAEVGINGTAAFAAFYTTGTLPGVMTRQRMSRRSGLRRRQW